VLTFFALFQVQLFFNGHFRPFLGHFKNVFFNQMHDTPPSFESHLHGGVVLRAHELPKSKLNGINGLIDLSYRAR
jgi:hypothetical protein